ncbi:MAG: hypothetical protein HQK78_15230, partial [Desulfobacterales bacterium]|nr:hypothetical protein [Desulfobacterales bacterium]
INRYDVIVSYSGGKDSSYTLYYLRKTYDLNILALLVDNDFVAKQAWENARNVTARLGIDLMIFKPDPIFMHHMFKVARDENLYSISQLMRANSICLSCINLISNITLNEAIIHKIPIVAGGYIDGQMPSSGGVIRTDSKFFKEENEKKRMYFVSKFGEKINNYYKIPECSENQIYPVIINPMLGLEYSENKVIETISKYGWQKPLDTGSSSSNCLLNDYAIAVHYQKYKYHSYESEICLQVRKGFMSKEEALSKFNDIKSPEDFTNAIFKF